MATTITEAPGSTIPVGYQGEAGAYSERAVRRLFPSPKTLPYPSVHRVFEAVEIGAVAFGVVPLGRYWLNADGLGGPEGRSATFNLGASSAGGNSTAGSGGGIDRGPGGTWGSDGTCWYVAVDGGDVMGPGC